jgi:hypothetical protein
VMSHRVNSSASVPSISSNFTCDIPVTSDLSRQKLTRTEHLAAAASRPTNSRDRRHRFSR